MDTVKIISHTYKAPGPVVCKRLSSRSKTVRSSDRGPIYITAGINPRSYISEHWVDESIGKTARLDRQSGQVKRSASGRDNIWANLLQRDDVIGLGGPDGEERRCNCGEHQ